MIHQGIEFTLFVDIPTAKQFGIKAALVLAALERAEREQCETKGELFVLSNKEITKLTDVRTAAIHTAINSLKNEGYIETTLIGMPPIRHFKIKHYDKEDTNA